MKILGLATTITRQSQYRLDTKFKPVGDEYRSEETAAICDIYPKYFIPIHPDKFFLNPEPLMLYDLRTQKTVDTTGLNESRRNSPIGVANPTDITTSSRYPLNNTTICPSLSFPV